MGETRYLPTAPGKMIKISGRVVPSLPPWLDMRVAALWPSIMRRSYVNPPKSAVSRPSYRRPFDVSTLDASDKSVNQWLTAALEEYKSLRVEIIDAIEAQRKIMQLGVTGLSVLIGLALQQQVHPLLSVALLTLLVPIVAIFITVGALGERFRASRASYFLLYKEEIINRTFDGSHPALEWEKWLRDRPVFIVRDRAEFLAVFSLSTGALGLGFYTVFTTPELRAQPLGLLVPLVVTSLILWITIVVLHFFLLARTRRQFLSGDTRRPG